MSTDQAYGILKQVETKDGKKEYGLLGFKSFTTESDRMTALNQARQSAVGWRAVYPSSTIIVAEVQAHMCNPVNNVDGFPNAKAL